MLLILCPEIERDTHRVYRHKDLRLYLPTGEDTYAVNEILTPAYDPDVHTAEIRAELPENIEYVYVRAEDFAGNVTVYRHYLDSGKGE